MSEMRTFSTIKGLINIIAPLPDEIIKQAISASSAENMRAQGKSVRLHVRSSKVGDWKNHLIETHLEIFRTKYSDLISKQATSYIRQWLGFLSRYI